ncbi:dipeptide/oligopeptide/nickel ABC transporter ATP-binding protein [Streptomyces sp. NPDC020807]|uniref:dipeptide/oligopeptide/nickel ABC transporter ATP-binding protein n=1 Tax=Streptomyces sp. NPDC020807 TaxID=3155119 RepID=UPI0033E5FD64
MNALLDVRDLVVRRGGRTVLDGATFTVAAGETVGLVGPSGCGKSTTAAAVLRLLRPDSGSVRFDGVELTSLPERRLRALRPRFQPVFQDPYGALSPRRRVRDQIAEPLRVHGLWSAADGPARVEELLGLVGLDGALGARLPHELSGGQCQRVGIARALATRPELLVLDEPTSALDPSVRAGVLNLLMDLQDSLGIGSLFVSHDLPTVRHVCDRVLTLRDGRLVASDQ